MLNVWWLPIVLKMIVIDTFYGWFVKGKIINKNFIERFFLQYLFAAVLATVFAAVIGELKFNLIFLIIFVIGAFNGYGAYASWRAKEINLSAMSIFSFMDDFTSVGLGYLVLKEAQYLNSGMSAGLALCISAILIFSGNNYNKYSSKKSKNHLPLKFFINVLSYSLIWGVATFATRYYAVEGVGVGTWLFGWYTGSLLTALMLFIYQKKRNLPREFLRCFEHSNTGLMLVSCLFIMFNIWAGYWALQLAPLTVVQPIFFSSAMIMPTIIGILFFEEGLQYDLTDRSLFAQTISGGILIAFSFGTLPSYAFLFVIILWLSTIFCLFQEAKARIAISYIHNKFIKPIRVKIVEPISVRFIEPIRVRLIAFLHPYGGEPFE